MHLACLLLYGYTWPGALVRVSGAEVHEVGGSAETDAAAAEQNVAGVQRLDDQTTQAR